MGTACEKKKLKVYFITNQEIVFITCLYLFSSVGRGWTELVYADGNTFSGVDSDDTFDSDDELVFMARHLGFKASVGTPNPPGVDPVLC